ncbi:hypothetical protein PVAND_008431 [Polypedilum vanderplanki]|uniref:Uncharacterized protein n=1 Tax=Polypedilum vanderplanki TaxID=319348 RepID=A0A9J6C9I1_POLVA|nr:hypothetical protein PVAND_008431 [Polypedilum vanderplanki]
MDGLFNFQLLKQIGHVLIDEYYKKLTQMNVKVLNNIYGRYPLSSYEFNAIITASTNHRAQVTSSLLQTVENILIAFTKSFWIRFPCDSDSELNSIHLLDKLIELWKILQKIL